MSDDFFSDAPPDPTPETSKWAIGPSLRLALFAAMVCWLAVIGLYCIAAHWW